MLARRFDAVEHFGERQVKATGDLVKAGEGRIASAVFKIRDIAGAQAHHEAQPRLCEMRAESKPLKARTICLLNISHGGDASSRSSVQYELKGYIREISKTMF